MICFSSSYISRQLRNNFVLKDSHWCRGFLCVGLLLWGSVTSEPGRVKTFSESIINEGGKHAKIVFLSHREYKKERSYSQLI